MEIIVKENVCISSCKSSRTICSILDRSLSSPTGRKRRHKKHGCLEDGRMILPERFQSVPEENLYLRRPAFVREYRRGGAPPPSYSFRTCVSKARWFLWTRGQQDDIDSKMLERVYSRTDLLERIFSSNLILSSFQKKKERKSFILAHHQEETTRYQATLKQRMLIKSVRREAPRRGFD